MPSESDLDVDMLCEAIEGYVYAKRTLDENQRRYHDGGGGSWGWAGSEDSDRLEKARAAVRKGLSEVIAVEVAKQLKLATFLQP